VERHRRVRKKLHWHIDSLSAVAGFHAALPVRSEDDLECDLASAMRNISEWSVPGFGCSDPSTRAMASGRGPSLGMGPLGKWNPRGVALSGAQRSRRETEWVPRALPGRTHCSCPSHLFGFSTDPMSLREFHEVLQYYRMDRLLEKYQPLIAWSPIQGGPGRDKNLVRALGVGASLSHHWQHCFAIDTAQQYSYDSCANLASFLNKYSSRGD
jgi:Uri superfamily endonuclease